MKGHKKQGSHPHDKVSAMPQFNEGHWERKQPELATANGKYTSGEMSNPEHLTKSVEALANYAKKHKAQH